MSEEKPEEKTEAKDPVKTETRALRWLCSAISLVVFIFLGWGWISYPYHHIINNLDRIIFVVILFIIYIGAISLLLERTIKQLWATLKAGGFTLFVFIISFILLDVIIYIILLLNDPCFFKDLVDGFSLNSSSLTKASLLGYGFTAVAFLSGLLAVIIRIKKETERIAIDSKRIDQSERLHQENSSQERKRLDQSERLHQENFYQEQYKNASTLMSAKENDSSQIIGIMQLKNLLDSLKQRLDDNQENVPQKNQVQEVYDQYRRQVFDVLNNFVRVYTQTKEYQDKIKETLEEENKKLKEEDKKEKEYPRPSILIKEIFDFLIPKKNDTKHHFYEKPEIPKEIKKFRIDFRQAQLQGADLNNTNLQGAYLTGTQLQGADLQRAQLQGAHLDKAQLQEADLKEAILQKADLQKAELQGTILINTQLQEAILINTQLQEVILINTQLQGADLRSAQLQGADLQAANLQGAELRFAQLQGADLQLAQLQGADLQWANLQGADLQWANLQGADLQWANLQGAQLQGADLQAANLQGAELRFAQLQGADLQLAQLQGADLQWANLQGADLQWANLQGADLQWANLQGAQLQGAQLQGADLQWANLQGAQLQGAQLQGADLQWANFFAVNIFHPITDKKQKPVNLEETIISKGQLRQKLEKNFFNLESIIFYGITDKDWQAIETNKKYFSKEKFARLEELKKQIIEKPESQVIGKSGDLKNQVKQVKDILANIGPQKLISEGFEKNCEKLIIQRVLFTPLIPFVKSYNFAEAKKAGWLNDFETKKQLDDKYPTIASIWKEN